MDALTLKDLHYFARHGYYDVERAEGNEFEVDLVFCADFETAGQTDDLTQTINYEKAEKITSRVMNGRSVKLIETLATKIGSRLFSEFQAVEKLTVRIRKLDPPVSVPTKYSQIERQWSR